MNRSNFFIWKPSKYVICLIVAFSIYINMNGQKDKQIDLIKNEIFSYLSDNGIMEKLYSIEEYEKRTFFFDLGQPSVQHIDSCGIYGFGPLSSNKKTYFFIVDNYKITILDPNQLSNNIIECINFLKKQKKTNEIVAKYVESILKIYKNNNMIYQGTLHPH